MMHGKCLRKETDSVREKVCKGYPKESEKCRPVRWYIALWKIWQELRNGFPGQKQWVVGCEECQAESPFYPDIQIKGVFCLAYGKNVKTQNMF